MNKTLDTSTWFFMDITVELPNGQRDLYKLHSTLNNHKHETFDETYRRRPDKRGRMGYREANISLWVDPEDYRGLCITLGKWPGTAKYTTIKPRKQ
jgi:hypothetical protein